MKEFLKEIAKFTFFISISFLLILQCFNWSNKRTLKQHKTEPVYHTVMLGDSHIQNGIDDRQLPGVINLSQQAEAFKFTYTKLKLIMESHPAIKQVLLGCSYHNLSNYYEGYEKGNSEENSFISSGRYFFFCLPGSSSGCYGTTGKVVLSISGIVLKQRLIIP